MLIFCLPVESDDRTHGRSQSADIVTHITRRPLKGAAIIIISIPVHKETSLKG